MVTEFSHDEKRLILAYYRQMETAVKSRYYTAVPSTDMKVLQDIYKRHINKAWAVRVWCSACCLKTLVALYPYAVELRKGNDGK